MFLLTHPFVNLGLLHCRVRSATPPPHVLEQEENSDQPDQEP